MDIEQACNLSRRNRESVAAVNECGCYFCLRVFQATDVVEWADIDEMTALCPICGVDSVLPGVTDVDVLASAHERWFCETPNGPHERAAEGGPLDAVVGR